MILTDPTHTEWDMWDLRLIKAYQLKKSYSGENPYPPWITRSERVAWEPRMYVDKYQAAVQRARDKTTTEIPGRVFYAVPKTVDGGPMPTMREWFEERLAQENGAVAKQTDPNRPPSLSMGWGAVLEEPVES